MFRNWLTFVFPAQTSPVGTQGCPQDIFFLLLDRVLHVHSLHLDSKPEVIISQQAWEECKAQSTARAVPLDYIGAPAGLKSTA